MLLLYCFFVSYISVHRWALCNDPMDLSSFLRIEYAGLDSQISLRRLVVLRGPAGRIQTKHQKNSRTSLYGIKIWPKPV